MLDPEQVLNGLPFLICRVSSDGEVVFVNDALAESVERQKRDLVGLTKGKVLQCANADKGEGCGYGEECKTCPVRVSIDKTFATGKAVYREEGRLILRQGDVERTRHFLVTTSLLSFEGADEVLLSLEDVTALKVAEASLREHKHALEAAVQQRTAELTESEERFRTITESSADAILITDQSGACKYANKAACALLGYTSAELTAMHIPDLHPREQKETMAGLFASLLEEGSLVTELDLVRKDGSIVPVDLNAVVLPNGQVYGSWRDNTERKRAEDALRESEERLRAQLKGSPVPTYIWRKEQDDFVLTDFNDAADEFTNGRISELVGSQLSAMYKDAPAIREEFWRCHDERRGIAREMPYHFKAMGQEKMLAVKYVFVPPDQVLVHTEDVTEQRRAERALQASEDKFSKAFHHNPAAIVLSVPETGKVAEVNRTTEQIFGFSREELLSKTTLELGITWPEDRDRARAIIQKRGFLRGFEAELTRKNGETRICLMYGEPIEINDRQYLITTAQDVTEQKRAERALKERLQFEHLLREMSTTLLGSYGELASVGPDGDVEIAHWLSRLVDHAGADRGRIWYAPDEDSPTTQPIAEVDSAGKPPAAMPVRGDYPWAQAKVLDGDACCFSSLTELPDEAARDKAAWAKAGVKAAAIVPMHAGGRLVGALILNSTGEERDWSPDLVDQVRLVASVLGNALERRRAFGELRVALAEVGELKERAEAENVFLRKEFQHEQEHGDIVGQSEAMRSVLALAEQVAPVDSSVLILGETGTGKELLARAIHRMSPRRHNPLVVVNCAAVPAALVEGELFGREKGAYTDALTKQVGRFEVADGSTIFLDEIGELPAEVQAKLLRVLQEGEIERLGSSSSIRVNVRVVAATNRDLAQEVASGRFRGDLYYRLNVFPIEIPPLRERRDDIAQLTSSFVAEFNEKMGRRVERIPQSVMDAVTRHEWKGNVRELRNAVERAMILCTGSTLKVDLPTGSTLDPEPDQLSLADVEKRHILRVLKQTGWRVRGAHGAAVQLEVKPTTLESRMRKLGITRPTITPDVS